MDPPTAALIGAGVASGVNLAGQWLGHVLSAKRDRGNQRRQRLFDTIVDAATALYAPLREEDIPAYAHEEPKPGTMADVYPDLAYPEVAGFMDKTFYGITLLQIHFGHDHWLLDEYVEACAICQKATATKARHFRLSDEEERRKDIPALAKTLREAQRARDQWMRRALAEVERI